MLLRGHHYKENKSAAKNVLARFQNIWLEFSEQQRKQEEEADSMYKFKSKSHCADTDEATLNEKSFKELFPSFNRDFNDLIPKGTLDDDDDMENKNTEYEKKELSEDDAISREGLSHNMSSVDVVQIYKNLSTIVRVGQQSLPEMEQSIEQLFLNGYKEFLSLASLDAVRKGGKGLDLIVSE